MAYCPYWAPLLGYLGATFALVFANCGSAYGTYKTYFGISHIVKALGRQKTSVGGRRAELQYDNIVKAMLPIVMSGVCGIFGLIEAVVIVNNVPLEYSFFMGASHLFAGLSVGLCNFCSGYAMGITGECGVRDAANQPKLYIGMVLVWSFANAIGLYGLIVGLLMASKVDPEECTSF